MADLHENDDGSTTESEYYGESDDNAPQTPTQNEAPASAPSILPVAIPTASVEATQTASEQADAPRWNSVLVAAALDTASRRPTHVHCQEQNIKSEAVVAARSPPPSSACATVTETVPISETESVSETVECVETETCPVCCVQLKPVEYFEALTARHSYAFCACCRRVQLDRRFTKSERQNGPLKRCRDCAPRTRDIQSHAMLPDREQNLGPTRAALKTLKQRYEWRLRPDSSLEVDPRVAQLTAEVDALAERKLLHITTVRLALQHGDATVAYSRVLYEELLLLDEQELALGERQVALYTELLAAQDKTEGVHEDPTGSGGKSPLPAAKMACEVCYATLQAPPVPEEDDSDIKAVLCTCCCLVLPQTSFGATQANGNCSYPRCSTCIEAEPQPKSKHLHANWPHMKKMSALFSILWRFRKQVKAEGKRVPQPFEAFLEAEADNLPAHTQLKLQQKQLKEINVQNRNLVNGFDVEYQGDRLRLSRHLYHEFVQAQGVIVGILPVVLEQLESLFRMRGINAPPSWRKSLKSAKWNGNNHADETPVTKKPRLQ